MLALQYGQTGCPSADWVQGAGKQGDQRRGVRGGGGGLIAKEGKVWHHSLRETACSQELAFLLSWTTVRMRLGLRPSVARLLHAVDSDSCNTVRVPLKKKKNFTS